MQDEKTTFHQIFERIVQQYADKPALVYLNEQGEQCNAAYAQLNAEANRFAHYLLEQGITRGKKVAIFVKDMRFFIICMLAVHKAGAAYIPINLNENNQVITDILTKSVPDLCVFPTAVPGINQLIKKHFPSTVVVNMDDLETVLAAKANDNPTSSDKVTVDDNAYIMFTSGSSGVPKGAVIKQFGLPKCFKAHEEILELKVDDRILQLAKVGFDASLMEILMALCIGAALYLVRPDIRDDDEKLRDYIIKNEITIAIFVPSKLKALENKVKHPSEFSKLRGIVVTGEAFTKETIQSWLVLNQEKNILRTIVNGYGLTETTICISVGKFIGHVLTIGKPIPGIKVHLLKVTDDIAEDMTHVQPAIGDEEAELYISGDSVTTGYINDPENTRKHLVKIIDPETKQIITAFRTRDSVRRASATSDELIYVNRLDNQIKLRGQRLDPEHIEALIKKYCIDNKPIIQDVRVVCAEEIQHKNIGETEQKDRKEIKHKHLVAYILPVNAENTPSVHLLHQHLKKILPVFMVPNAMQWLQQFPLSGNGKSARRALASMRPIPFIKSNNTAIAVTDAEKKLAEIWSNLLGIHNYQIKCDDDFFCLGGSSLLVSELITIISQHKHYFPLPDGLIPEQIYLFSSLKKMAELLTYSPLRRLHAGDSKQIPIFLMHSLLGDGWTEYQQLSGVLKNKFPDHSIYAFHANVDAFNTQCSATETLEDLAGYYANLISLQHQEKKVIIMGWSSGGFIGFAVARQLEGKNITPYVFMFDSDTPDVVQSKASDPKVQTQLKMLIEKKDKSVQEFANWLLTAEAQCAEGVLNTNIKIHSDIYSFDADETRKHWANYTTGRCVNYPIATDHFGIIQDPDCLGKIIAEIKKIKIAKALSQLVAEIKSYHAKPMTMNYLLNRNRSWELNASTYIPLDLIETNETIIKIRIAFDEALSKIQEMVQKKSAVWASNRTSIAIVGISDFTCRGWCGVIAEDLKKAGFEAKKKFRNFDDKIDPAQNTAGESEQVFVRLVTQEDSVGQITVTFQLMIHKNAPENDKNVICFNRHNYFTALLTLLLKMLINLGVDGIEECLTRYQQHIETLRLSLINIQEILLPDAAISHYASILNYNTDIPERKLIEGLAGSGKTLFMKFLAQQWALGSLWYKQFDCVLHLLARNFPEESKLNAAVEFTLAHAIYYRYFGYTINEKKLLAIQQLLASHYRILILIDGFEEIESALRTNSRLTKLVHELSPRPHLLVTARPERTTTFVFDRVVRNFGFSAAAINRYLENYFQNNHAESEAIEHCIENHPALREICNIPITLELICCLWERDRNFFLQDNVTITRIYQKIYSELIDHHWQINVLRNDGDQMLKTPHVKQAVMQCLAKAAFLNALVDNSAIVSGKIWRQAYTEISQANDVAINHFIASAHDNPGMAETFRLLKLSDKPWFNYVQNSGLLNSVISSSDLQNASYEFIHSRFQDFLIACYIAESIEVQIQQTIDKKIVDFIQKHLFDSRFEHVWIFLIGLLKSDTAKDWFFKVFAEEESEISIERLTFKLKCLNEVDYPDTVPIKTNSVKYFTDILTNALESENNNGLIYDCRKILLHCPFLLKQSSIIITIARLESSVNAKFLLNCFPILHKEVFEYQIRSIKSSFSDSSGKMTSILLFGPQSTGKSSLINTMYSAFQNSIRSPLTRTVSTVNHMLSSQLQFLDTPGFLSISDDHYNQLQELIRGKQVVSKGTYKNRYIPTTDIAIHHPLAAVRANAVLQLKDSVSIDPEVSRVLMTVAFGDVNSSVRDLALSILGQQSLKSQYHTLLTNFDYFLANSCSTTFLIKLFESKPEYLQYFLTYLESDLSRKSRFFDQLLAITHQSEKIYQCLLHLADRYKLASEIIKLLATNNAQMLQSAVVPADQSLRELVTTDIFRNAVIPIEQPRYLAGPHYADNPNIFFPPKRARTKRDDKAVVKEEKNKTYSDKSNKHRHHTNTQHGAKGRIFQAK